VEISVVGDWVFYLNGSDGSKLYKIRTDGSSKTKLNDEKSFCINIVDDWIYYSTQYYGKKLYKMRIGGSGKAKLNDDECSHVNVIGDWVYYHKKNDDKQGSSNLYRIRTDSTERQVVD